MSGVKQHIDCLYILDKNTAFLGESLEGKNYKLIQSREEWEKFDIYKFAFDSIVILCELNWSGISRQNFYGFEIAVKLRRKYKLPIPIILTSMLNVNYFEKQAKTNVKYNILFSPGLQFLDLLYIKQNVNEAVEELNKYPLSQATISDVNEMLLDLRGTILDKITHQLRYNMRESKLEEVMQEIGFYLDKYQLNKIEWAPIKQQLKYSIDNKEIFNRYIGELIGNCERELKNNGDAIKSTFEKKHNIIVLEDDPKFRNRIENNLLEHFEEVFITGKASEAIQKLSEDKDNSYTAIIADWRLYKKKTSNYWQSWQGYNVLDYAANNSFIALFSLTSLYDRNVHKIRNELGLDIHLLKKQYLEAEGKQQWDMMADTIKQGCDQVTELIASRPTGARWTLNSYTIYEPKRLIPFQSLKSKYVEVRNSASWKVFEDDISNEANKLWSYYKKALTRKGIHLSEFASIKSKFGYEIAKKESELNTILIVRRVYLALILSAEKIYHKIYKARFQDTERVKVEYGMERDSVVNAYCILNGIYWQGFLETFAEDIGKKKGKVTMTEEEQASKALIDKGKTLAYRMCVKPEKLPEKGILPEEQKWLVDKGIDIDKGNSVPDYKTFEERYNSDNENDSFDREPTDDEIREASDDDTLS